MLLVEPNASLYGTFTKIIGPFNLHGIKNAHHMIALDNICSMYLVEELLTLACGIYLAFERHGGYRIVESIDDFVINQSHLFQSSLEKITSKLLQFM